MDEHTEDEELRRALELSKLTAAQEDYERQEAELQAGIDEAIRRSLEGVRVFSHAALPESSREPHPDK
jgi:hypothetical protein